MELGAVGRHEAFVTAPDSSHLDSESIDYARCNGKVLVTRQAVVD